MSVLPRDASFEEQVAEFFSTLRGKGLSLSPLDLELLSQWRQTGAPVSVIARGLVLALEQSRWDAPADEHGPRSLRACRRQVDREIRKFLALAIGRTQANAESAGADGASMNEDLLLRPGGGFDRGDG